MDVSARGGPSTDPTDARLTSLIGRSPDRDLDVAKLRHIADGSPGDHVAGFCREIRTSDRRREVPLRELLHGLELVRPISFWDRLHSRAVNVLRRSELASWSALCQASVSAIEEIHGAGPGVVDSTVAGMAKEWADAYLSRWGVSGATARRVPGHQLTPPDPPAGLAELSLAFEHLEAQPRFAVFAARLVPAGKPPTYRELAERSGRSDRAISPERSRIRRHLRKRMRDPAWPITVAVNHIEERIGSLATPSETDAVFTALHRESGALGREHQHRRTLLLWLGGYLLSEEWVLSRDLDLITGVLLQALVNGSSTDTDRVAIYLTRFGIRQHLQLPWLASQNAYRIVDGSLFRMDLPESG